jgi:hypothetical protein
MTIQADNINLNPIIINPDIPLACVYGAKSHFCYNAYEDKIMDQEK